MAREPERIGKYRVLGKIAEGGMGAVYKSKHPTLNRLVILKKLTIRSGTAKGRASFAERFRREARIMMDFKNERIVDVYDHFRAGASYYIVEEYVDGISLDKLIRRERYLPSDAALLIFLEACRALEYAHDKTVIHRDIKPGNILISTRGEVKLVDFGISTIGDEEQDDGEALTREGMTLGTLSYMPPEQIQNSKNVDQRADIYAMGAMLYEMVTGKAPFPGSFTPESIDQIRRGSYVPVRQLNPDVAPVLRRIIRRSMQRKPERRYRTLAPVIRLLERRNRRTTPQSIHESIRSYIDGEPLSGVMRRRLPIWALAGSAAAVLLLAAATMLSGLYRPPVLYELVAADSHGAYGVVAQIPRGVKPLDATFMRAQLFREDADTVTAVADLDLRFTEDEDAATEQHLVLSSQTVYLPKGIYRLKLTVEDTLTWDTFYLGSRREQRNAAATQLRHDSRVMLRAPAPAPLTVDYRITDAVSGADITNGSEVSLLSGQRWVPVTLRSLRGLSNASVHRFRFERAGYLPKVYGLRVDPFQRLLRVNVALAPISGTLVVNGAPRNVRLQLNGGDTYQTGGAVPEQRKVPAANGEQLRLELAPGDYVLTASRGADAVASVSFTVPAGGEVAVAVSYDRQQRTLQAALGAGG